ncbi:MAG: hypothetical protein PXX83_08060 [Candidatus Nitrosotalea sp.]|nr:hypothetical protein [Candidatus Nitrosotalea sp.]
MSQPRTMNKQVKTAAIIVAVLTVSVVIIIVSTSMTDTQIDYAVDYHKITIPVDHFTTMPPDPYPTTDYHRPVFFMKPNSIAHIYVRYFATWDYPNMIDLGRNLSVYNATNHQPLSDHQLVVSVDPTGIPHKNGENYTVVYSFIAKSDAQGIYGMAFSGCYNRGGDVDIAVGLNSSQIRPQDIPVSTIAAASCQVGGFIENQIIGFVNATVEYKPAIRVP